MKMGPGSFSDIGKRAKDLLYDGFFWDQKLEHSTYSGVHMMGNGTMKNDFSLSAERNPQLLPNKIDSPGPKTTFSFAWPQWRSSKVLIQYLHDYAGIEVDIGLGNTMAGLAAAVGTDAFVVGADIGCDMLTRKLTKFNVRMSMVNDDLIKSLALSDKGDNLNGSYYYLVNPLTGAAVGGELNYRFSTNKSTMTCGARWSLNQRTMVKARINNHGQVGALIQYKWHPKSFISISGEIDCKSIFRGSKLGLHLVIP